MNISKRNAELNNVFDVKNMITLTKFFEMKKNAIFVRASIYQLNAEHSMSTENALTTLTSTRREAFNATSKRKRSKNSIQSETTNRLCTSKSP
jgi:hypothetical protein